MPDAASTRILETLTLRGQRAAFPTSQWNLVRQFRDGQEKEAAHALAELCRLYWPPIYAFLRKNGHKPAAAQDLTQSFFHKVIEQGAFKGADPERGRLRTYLLTILQRHVTDQYRHENARKRGGGAEVLSMDEQEAESYFGNIPANHSTPETCFERAWAQRLLDVVHARTRGRYERIGKTEEFNRLEPFLAGEDPAPPYRQLAEEMKVTESAVRLLLHRMRRRFRKLLEEEIASTVSSEADAKDELGHLFRILGR